MATLTVHDKQGAEVGKVDVDVDAIAPEVNKQLMHEAVVMYQANQRQGTFRTKNRGEVSGTTKKMYRQKGTGNARAGSKRSGIRRGGGHIFAKRPRDFSYRLNKKEIRLATRMALASKFKDDEVVVVDDFGLDGPRTSAVAATLKALGCEGGVLLATAGYDAALYLSSRNIPAVEVSPVRDFNALSLLRPAKVVMTKGAVEELKKCFVDGASVGAAPAAASTEKAS